LFGFLAFGEQIGTVGEGNSNVEFASAVRVLVSLALLPLRRNGWLVIKLLSRRK
jgi:hypothetical protein